MDRRQQRGVWRYLRWIGCPAADADDLAQEALLAAIRKRVPERARTEAARWLRRAARNLWRQHLRHLRRSKVVLDPEVDERLVELAFARHGSEDGGDAWIEALRGCVGSLDAGDRRLLALRYEHDNARAEIAAELGLQPEGAKTRLRRLRDQLKACVMRKVGARAGAEEV